MKRFSVLFILLCLALIPLARQASEGDEASKKQKSKFTKHFRETYFSITEKGGYSVEILPDEKEYRIGKDVVGIVIHNDRDQDVEGAVIDIAAGDGSEKFTIRDKGEGLYTVSGLNLKREGEWKLVVRINSKSVSDQAVFVFPSVPIKFLKPGSYDIDGLK